MNDKTPWWDGYKLVDIAFNKCFHYNHPDIVQIEFRFTDYDREGESVMMSVFCYTHKGELIHNFYQKVSTESDSLQTVINDELSYWKNKRITFSFKVEYIKLRNRSLGMRSIYVDIDFKKETPFTSGKHLAHEIALYGGKG